MDQNLRGYDNAIRTFRLNMFGLLFLRYLLAYLTVLGFIWGAAVLVLRITTHLERVVLLWPLVGLAPVVLVAFLRSWAKIPAQSSLKASLDNQSRCGGLFMASDEVEIGGWQGQMPAETLPKLRWKGGKSCFMTSIAAIFVLIAFLVPQRFVKINRPGELDISDEIQQLSDQLELLAEEEIITQIEAKELAEEFENIRKEASGLDPAKTWESLDHLQDKLTQKASEATQKALSQTEKASQAQTLAEAMMHGADMFDQATLAEAMAEMAAMMNENEAIKNAIDKETLEKLKKALKNGQLSAADLGKLCQAMKLSKAQIRQCLGKMCDAKLIDPKALQLCDGLSQCDGEKLAAFLAEEGSCIGMKECIGMCSGNLPGRGGINRGQGDAPMSWQQESSEQGVKFKEQVLPPASFAALKDSKLAGVSLGTPSEETPTSTATSGALTNATAAGGSANTQTILPKHKATVKRYFERK